MKTGTEHLPPEEHCWYLMGSSHHLVGIVPGLDDADVPLIFSEPFSTLAFILKYIYECTAQIKAQECQQMNFTCTILHFHCGAVGRIVPGHIWACQDSCVSVWCSPYNLY